MTIEQLKQLKKEKGYTYAQISELSGVPLGTVQKLLNGETKSPRYNTLQALDKAFGESCVSENALDYQTADEQAEHEGENTIDDYRNYPQDKRVELIDGVFYDMAAPTTLHQRIVVELLSQLSEFIKKHHGKCIPFVAPVDVQLFQDDYTMVQPDVLVICNEEKLKSWGIFGAPDFAVEVLSDSSRKKDTIKKLDKYESAGVREYWIVDPAQKCVFVYFFEGERYSAVYPMNLKIPVNIYDGKLQIDLSVLMGIM